MKLFTTRSNLLTSAAISAVLLAAVAPTAVQASNGYYNNGRLVIYFTRHAEKQTVTTKIAQGAVYTSELDANGDASFIATDATQAIPVSNPICGVSKCAEELSEQGIQRAMLLADWFGNRHITHRLDAVYATHKTRTQQTVMPTATAAGLDVTILNPEFSELNDESTTPSECSTLQAIESARSEGLDTILIAGHSGTLYDIMGDGVKGCFDASGNALTGLGLDTGNTVKETGNLDRFPKDGKGKVRDFGDIWKVTIKQNDSVRFGFRVNLQQPARLTVDNFAR